MSRPVSDAVPPRPPRHRRAAARSVLCHGCGLPGRTAREIADLDTPWLVPAPAAGPDDTSRAAGAEAGVGLVQARFCRRCAPTGPTSLAGLGQGRLRAARGSTSQAP